MVVDHFKSSFSSFPCTLIFSSSFPSFLTPYVANISEVGHITDFAKTTEVKGANIANWTNVANIIIVANPAASVNFVAGADVD